MCVSWRCVFLTMVVMTVLPVAGQEPVWNRQLESDPFPPFQRPVEVAGTVSLAELRNPLKGAALNLLHAAEKHLGSGDTGRGMEILRTALANPQAAPLALGFLGTEHLKQGLTDTAIVELGQSVDLLPGNALTQSNLAYALFVKGQNEQGLEHARKAVQLDPGRPKSRYVLGQLLTRLGRLEEAKFHLRIAALDISGARQLLENLEPALRLTGTSPPEPIAKGIRAKD